MIQNTLLLMLLLPALAVPFVYLVGKKSAKSAAVVIAVIALAEIALLSTSVPTILGAADHKYVESYYWIPVLNSSLTLFVDGVSFSMVMVTLVLVFTAALFSVNYMQGKKSLAVYYTLLAILSTGLVGVFITSNLLFFYFCWELMLVPAYFIIGGWGYGESYRAAFKFFVFTHAGAVFVLLGIGAIYMVTGATDMFQAQAALMTASPDIVRWILLALTAGFAVKMAVVPVHMWLPDAYSEAPAPMSALLSGVITGAGAYAMLRVSLGVVFPAIMATDFGTGFLHALAVFGVMSALFGSLIALFQNDMKRVLAYSSISHMGYVLFGLSLFSSPVAIAGAVLHLVNHAVSKGLLFLSAGAVTKQVKTRDIRKMGGLAGQMPITAVCSTTGALSIAGIPPFACFISELLIFIGAFQTIKSDGFYFLPTALMFIAVVLSLAYVLRYLGHVFFGSIKSEKVKEVPSFMKFAMLVLAVIVIILFMWPTFFINIITTFSPV
jgi:NADH-quinone oxidoreductase subunit M